jgi:hypothetical protein
MSNPSIPGSLAPAVRVSLAAFVLASAACLCRTLPPALVLLPLLAVVPLWWLFRHPVGSLGVVLAIMPFHFMAVMLGQFFGLPHVDLISGLTKEIPLLILAAILLWRNGFRPTTADWFLACCLGVAVLRTAIGGTLSGLRNDFEFVLPYLAGRVTVLSCAQQKRWAIWAVWIAAVVSFAGVVEVYVLGPAPRRLLYALVSTDLVSTSSDRLPNAFYATGLDGLRAASTMIGPPSLAALCMIALILWWAYMRNPIPAAAVCLGLVFSLTRSAWIGLAVAICMIASRMKQSHRLAAYAAVALVGFIALIPVLGLSDYLSLSRSGQDPSEQSHRENEASGVSYVYNHPFGAGAGGTGPVAAESNANALVIENTYLEFAAEYGAVSAMCFLGFLISATVNAWRYREPLGYAAFGILVGVGLMMAVLLMHEDFRLACWVWFPVGLLLRRKRVSGND